MQSKKIWPEQSTSSLGTQYANILDQISNHMEDILGPLEEIARPGQKI